MLSPKKIREIVICNKSSHCTTFQMIKDGSNERLLPIDETNVEQAPSIPGCDPDNPKSECVRTFDLKDYEKEISGGVWRLFLYYHSNGSANPWLTSNESFIYSESSTLRVRYELENFSCGVKLVFKGYESIYSKPKKDDSYYPSPMSFDENEEDSDFVQARAGYIVGTNLDSIEIKSEVNGKKIVTWDMPSYSFLQGPSPKSVHKNLWRMEKLNNISGIFQVWPKVNANATTDDIKRGVIFQARSYDLATMSFVKVGEHEWVVIDPLLGEKTATTAWDDFKKNVDEDAHLIAIMITHSHVDHYKGANGLVEHAKIGDETIQIIAPAGFYDEAISENLYLGNCMGRRAQYMYGSALPRGIFGSVGTGLGKTVSVQNGSIPNPTTELLFEKSDKEVLEIGTWKVEFVFQNVPGTEAPAEMHIGFKIDGVQILCPGENICQTMHNLLTPRGAKVRDPKAFGKAIDRALELFSDVEVLIGTHHWPTWGAANCRDLMEKQRDMYYFFNNQVIHLLNSGYNMDEIAERFVLPKSLSDQFYNRGYYGTMNHDAKAVAQRYIGWWDGNPANYFKYPEEEFAKRFVADMGGAAAVLAKAMEYFNKSDYRWTVELTRNVVFSKPDDGDVLAQAKLLEADALEQLAYSFEAGTWRNIFLAGAYELRGIPQGEFVTKDDIIESICSNMLLLKPEYIFEYISILIEGNRASEYNVDETCTIGNDSFSLSLKNGVLHFKKVTCEGSVHFDNVPDFVIYVKACLKHMKGPMHENLNEILGCIELQNPQWNIVEPIVAEKSEG